MDPPEALSGLRVLELSGPPGFYCGKLLADLGADVVRIDSSQTESPDPGPFLGCDEDANRSLYRYHFHTNKRSVALDLKTPEGRDVLVRLLAAADIVLDTFPPQEATSLGLDPSSIGEKYPALIRTSITGFGSDGTYRDYKVSDLIGLAMGGLMAITGFPEDPPTQLGGEQAYHSVSLHAAVGTLLAVAQRSADGKGRYVEVAVQDAVSMAILQTANFNFYTRQGIIPARTGTEPRTAAAGNVRFLRGPSIVRCKDGWVTYTTPPNPPRLWNAFVSWLDSYGMAEELTESRFEDADARAAESARISAVQQAFFQKHTRQELYHEAQRRGLLCMPIQTIDELLADKQLQARGYFVDVEHPELEQTFVYPGAPYKLSETPFRIKRRAPLIGEDTDDVLREWLGVPADESSAPVGADRRGAMSAPTQELPLSGVRVVDFCWLIAGPLGTRTLAHFGAEVIKIESEVRIDTIRNGGPRPEGNTSPNIAGVFNDINTSKLSLTLDMTTPQAKEIVKRLIRTADVVTNNYSGEAMDRWGLGYDDLVKIKPDIIMLSMPVMGTTGPHRDYGGYGSHINAGAGINAISGFPGRPPVGSGSLYPDFSSNPYHAAFAVLAALHYRQRTGKGQFIDLAQYESTLSLLGTSVLQYTMLGRVPGQGGNRSSVASPHGVYRCAGSDRWCAIAVSTDAEWRGLRAAIGSPSWSAEPRFQALAGRKAHEDELDRLLEQWTSEYPAYEVMERLQHHGVPAGVVQDIRDLLENDSSFRRRHVRFINQPDRGNMTVHGETIRISGLEPRVERSPMLMEHNDHVLVEILGMDRAEIDELNTEGVIR